MIGWFRAIQEVTVAPRLLAKLILKQDPVRLKWASNRLWEFAQKLAYDHELIPDRVANGFSWTGKTRWKKDDELAYFDHYYGVGKHPYGEEEVKLRLGLHLCDDARPYTVFESRLFFEHYVEDGAGLPIRSGRITLEGQDGKWWASALINCISVTETEVIHRHFPSFTTDIVEANNVWIGMRRTQLKAADARAFFAAMTECFLAFRPEYRVKTDEAAETKD